MPGSSNVVLNLKVVGTEGALEKVGFVTLLFKKLDWLLNNDFEIYPIRPLTDAL